MKTRIGFLGLFTMMFAFNMAHASVADELRGLSAGEPLSWKVGDETNYKVDIGFIKGIMQNKVTSVEAEGLWLAQNIDLGFAGKQEVKTLFDPATGEVKRQIVNGKEEPVVPPKVEVVEVKMETITVPAGTFESAYLRIRDLISNTEYELWVNERDIPLNGMLKNVQPTSAGTATISLTSFRRN